MANGDMQKDGAHNYKELEDVGGSGGTTPTVSHVRCHLDGPKAFKGL